MIILSTNKRNMVEKRRDWFQRSSSETSSGDFILWNKYTNKQRLDPAIYILIFQIVDLFSMFSALVQTETKFMLEIFLFIEFNRFCRNCIKLAKVSVSLFCFLTNYETKFMLEIFLFIEFNRFCRNCIKLAKVSVSLFCFLTNYISIYL